MRTRRARGGAPSNPAGRTNQIEPCIMCAGCAYWGNLGRVVYGVSEEALLALTGDHDDNPTMSLPCREVFERGQKPVEVMGPCEAVADDILARHRDYWRR